MKNQSTTTEKTATVWTPKTIAAEVNVSAFAVRKFLRSTKRFDDGGYTRYTFGESDAKEIIAAFKASRNRTVEPLAKGDLATKPAKVAEAKATPTVKVPEKKKTRRVTPK